MMFMGFEGFRWFHGVVEGRMDPLRQGRLQVRVMGLHTDQKSKDAEKGIPTEELLWMHPMQPITSAAMSGIGETPLGPVEGTMVIGFFRDEFCQDGVVMGTTGGSYNYQPNPARGFSDPNGQYPRYLGNDLNILAGGGQKSESLVGTGDVSVVTASGKKVPAVVAEQEDNRTTAQEPNEEPPSDIPEDNNPEITLEKMLKYDEGVKYKLYWDHLGYPTIGIGHLIMMQKTKNLAQINALISQQVGRTVTDGAITVDECSRLFAQDVAKLRAQIPNFSRVNAAYQKCNASRRMAIENMCFQMGTGGLNKFKNTLAAMVEGRWNDAYNGLLDSLWARQTPGRAQRVAKIIRDGNLESYAFLKPKTLGERPTLRTAMFDEDDDSLETPPPPKDPNVMFEEPASPWAAQYPYNHVRQTESGHIVEFDDTPGAERIKEQHKSGTFYEVHPNGQKVTKIIGDDYEFDMANKFLKVSGDYNIVVDGNVKIYVKGNVTQVIDGNVNETIKGDVTSTVQGNVAETVFGNVDVHIDGNLMTHVDGDVEEIFRGNYKRSVTGNVVENYNGEQQTTVKGSVTQKVSGAVTQTVDGDFKNTAGSISQESKGSASYKSSGQTDIKGSVINLN